MPKTPVAGDSCPGQGGGWPGDGASPDGDRKREKSGPRLPSSSRRQTFVVMTTSKVMGPAPLPLVIKSTWLRRALSEVERLQ